VLSVEGAGFRVQGSGCRVQGVGDRTVICEVLGGQALVVGSHRHLRGLGFRNNYFTEKCSGSEAGSSLRLEDFVHHSTLGLRVIKKKKMER